MKKRWLSADTICILSASGIGDALMSTPLIRQIKKLKSKVRLIIVGYQPSAVVFRNNPCINRLLTYSLESQPLFSLFRLIRDLRREKPDFLLAAQPSNTVRHSIVAALSGAPVRMKHSYDYGPSVERDYSFAFSKLMPDVPGRHRVELNLDLLRYLGVEVTEKSTRLVYEVDDEAQAERDGFIEKCAAGPLQGKLVSIHPGGNRPDKKWPAECYAAVAGELVEKGFAVFIVGGHEEMREAERIAAITGGEMIFAAAGELSLAGTAALLEKSSFLLCNDTGIMHLAAAVGIPVIALFGPTDPSRVGPFSENAKVIWGKSSMESIGVGVVMKAIESIERS